MDSLNYPYRYIDHAYGHYPLESFGYDDMLCEMVGSNESERVIRSWVHQNTIVLGIKDARLPHLKDGLEYLESLGYHYIVRNSGGLGVVLDDGVLNVSLIIPGGFKVSIDDGYEMMYDLIQSTLSKYNLPIDAKIIEQSYCPGDYDLSIHGKKFAGISQRRIKNAIAVQIYLCVSGSGSDRARLMREFYRRATDKSSQENYPNIDPTQMASLNELLGTELTAMDMMMELLITMKSNGSKLLNQPLSSHEIDRFEYYYDRVLKRNEKMIKKGVGE